MKILTFSTLFPNAIIPSHGIFVENRLRQLRAYAPYLQARVIAPVPWFPFKHSVFGQYGKFAQVPEVEERHGLTVRHPRYLVIPKVGMNQTPWTLYRAARGAVKHLLEEGYDFDVIDAHYFYPDGVSAMYLAREFNKPFVVTGRGTDLNLFPQYARPRQLLRQVIGEASHMITVAGALKERLLELGAGDEQVTVLRNGVELDLFVPPADRSQLRKQLGVKGNTLVSVGNLLELKGHHLIIEAIASLPGWNLLLIGSGPQEKALRARVEQLSLADRVRFVGRVDQRTLRRYYGAADALVLASSREGWANVLLESMACGTPAIATPVGGTPEVVADPAAGILMRERSAAAIVDAVHALQAAMPNRADTRAYAEHFGWEETSQGQLDVFTQAPRLQLTAISSQS